MKRPASRLTRTAFLLTRTQNVGILLRAATPILTIPHTSHVSHPVSHVNRLFSFQNRHTFAPQSK